MKQWLETDAWETSKEIHATIWTKFLYKINEVFCYNFKNINDKTFTYVLKDKGGIRC